MSRAATRQRPAWITGILFFSVGDSGNPSSQRSVARRTTSLTGMSSRRATHFIFFRRGSGKRICNFCMDTCYTWMMYQSSNRKTHPAMMGYGQTSPRILLRISPETRRRASSAVFFFARQPKPSSKSKINIRHSTIVNQSSQRDSSLTPLRLTPFHYVQAVRTSSNLLRFASAHAALTIVDC